MNTPNPLPKGTTKEQWDAYQLADQNHTAWIKGRKEFLQRILDYVFQYGIEATREKITRQLDQSESMDAPNHPGYTRALND